MLQKFLHSFSLFGLSLGLLFFCASLTPSLLPRPPLLQGVLSGLSLAVGYGVASLIGAVWRFLELPPLSMISRRMMGGVAITVAVLALITLTRMSEWQNSIRTLMEMPAVTPTNPAQIVGVALVLALVLVMLARLLIWAARKVIRAIAAILPPRLSIGVGVLTFGILLALFVDGFIVKRALAALDDTFAALDRAIDDGVQAPVQATSSGSADSLIAWEDIGRTGKNFIANGATAQQIEAVTGRPAAQPVRIYAGYGAGRTLEARAQLALDDLKRAGGFERATLVVATATGTGWMDPAAMEPLAHVLDGDVAIVTLQYSYLPSWLTLIIDPDRSRKAARALFDAVYDHWTTLPRDTRPKLYLFGLSLGALGSEASLDLLTQLEDPINGALWAGPPFASGVWPQVVAGRNPSSPAWRPEFRDGRMIRFMNRDGQATSAQRDWGKMRLLYLQHPSDPMIFFSPDLAFNRPDWLVQRGDDVSPYFEWYPIVTFLQVMFDIPLATSVPAGYGHTYDAKSYLAAWVELMDPEALTEEVLERLSNHFADFSASPL